MKETMRILALAAAVLLGGEARAQAQMADGRKVFVNVNGGIQLSDRSIFTRDSFRLYDEDATVEATQPVSGGAIFDISAGYQVWGGLFAGVAITTFSDGSSSTVTASIPDRLLFETPRLVTLTVDGLTRRERGTHILFGWFIPVVDNVDVAVSVGPSFMRLTQEFVSTVTVALNTQDATAVVVDQSGTGVGVHFGVDGTYTFTPNVGAGLFLRVVRASVDLDALPGAKVGGVQMGVGARIRF